MDIKGWMKSRLSKKSKGVQEDRSGSGSSAAESSPDQFGLHILFDSTSKGEEQEPLTGRLNREDDICFEELDIIAVHGLGGAAFRTWTHPATKTLWLRDLLPQTFKKSRVMTYGYDAGVHKSKSTLRIMDNAENLLYWVMTTRNTEMARRRKIIFIGHSMGGIVIKKALVMAREGQKYSNIISSTKGVVFMGTPHDGADAAKLALTIANIANTVTNINKVNLQLLQRDSEPLTEISRSFGFLAQHLRIVTIVESNETQIPYIRKSLMVVPQSSARLNLGDRETVFSIIDADHHLVCKFEGKESLEYQKVRSAIKALATFEDDSERHLPTLNIPFEPDPDFVGRESVLRDLQKITTSNGHARHALYGLGGVGKSSIAIEYATRLNILQPSTWIFWVHGANSRRFKQSYREIANILELPERYNPQVNVVELVVNWLRNEKNGKWLMILDNADDRSLYFPKVEHNGRGREETQPPEALGAYLPQSRNGCILVTSRDRQTALELVFNKSANLTIVEPMEQDVAESLVRKRLSAEQIGGADLPQFVEMLDHIPLAITQACAYLEHSSFDDDSAPMTIAEYESIFREKKTSRLHLLESEHGDQRRDAELPSSVVTTWQISFEQLKSENPFAADMLSLMSVLDRQGIPKSLIQLDGDPLVVREALSRLQSFCLVKAEKGNQSFEMHRLVQISLRAWLDGRSETAKWICRAVDVLRAEFPRDAYFTPDNWHRCSQYLSHAQAILAEDASPAGNEGLPVETRAKAAVNKILLLNLVGNYLDSQGLFLDAIQCHHRAWETSAALLGPEHPDSLAHYANVAQTLCSLDEHSRAEAIDRKIIQTLDDSPSDARDARWSEFYRLVQGNLARVLHHQGKHAEARAVAERSLEIHMQAVGIEDENTWRTMEGLAESLAEDGEFEKAEALCRSALEKQRAGVGPKNIFTLGSWRGLAHILYEQKKYEEAEAEVKALIEVEKTDFPDGHPDRLRSAKTLGRILLGQNRFAEAEGVLRSAQADGEKFSSPTLLMSELRAELAGTLLMQDKYNEAISIYLASLDLRNKLLPVADLTTCDLMTNLATAYRMAGRTAEQQDMCWQVLQTLSCITSISMKHDFRAFWALAKSFGIRDPEALDPANLPETCAKILRAQPGHVSSDWQAFKPRVSVLSVFLRNLGRTTEALELGVRFRDRSDFTTLQAVQALIEIYSKTDRETDAVQLVEEVDQDFATLLGPEDLITRQHRNLLNTYHGRSLSDQEPGPEQDETIVQRVTEEP